MRVQAYLGHVPPDGVRVELYADPVDGSGPEAHVLERVEQLPGALGGFSYSANIATSRPPSDFTPRVVPWQKSVAVPSEARLIRWYPV